LGVPGVLLAAHQSRNFQRLVRLYGHKFAVRRAETDDDFLSGFVHVLSEHCGKRQGVPERPREMIENRT
jgi:hypothetical protein